MQIRRTLFVKEIVAEFTVPKDRSSQKMVILCAGVPGSTSKDELLEFWARKGYWAFFIRYRGSWESKGEFLRYSLEKDVLDVIDALPKGFVDVWSGKKFKLRPQNITVIGSSFGGPAAILSTLDPRVQKAICISPVVDWQAENKSEPLEDLYHILKVGYSGAYRMSKTQWNKLARGKFYNPVKHLGQLDPTKILIFHAENDDIVRYKPVAKFAKKLGCELITLKKGGHLSSTLMMRFKHYRRVANFLKKI